MSLHELPHQNKDSWRTASLNELGQLYCGQSPASSTVNTNGLGTLYVSGPEQWDGHKIRQDKWTNDPKRLVPDGCIFITVKGAGVGKIFPGISCAIGRDVYAFKPKAKLSAKFIEHAIRFTVQDVLRHAVGDIPGLSKAHILQHEIGLPEPQEQERIVGEIEKQFSRLDEAVANLKRVKANLKRYKASVLKAAVEGKFESIDPSGWTRTNLGAVLTTIEAGKSFKCEERFPNIREIGVVKVSAVTWGTYNEEESKTCLDPDRIETRYFVKPGDFLFSRANTIQLVGACVIAQKVNRRIMLSDKILRFHFSDMTVPQWVLYWLRSDIGRKEIQRLSTGNQESMRNIGQERIRQIAFSLPGLEEQRAIVDEVERRLSVIEELESAVEANLTRADRLRQSTLRSAFSGQLCT